MIHKRKQAINYRERERERGPKYEGRGEKLALRSSTNDAWGEIRQRDRKKGEMTCLEQTNP